MKKIILLIALILVYVFVGEAKVTINHDHLERIEISE